MAEANGVITAADRVLVETVSASARLLAGSRPNTFVHGDYKLINLTVMKDTHGWLVAGVFDLHEAWFGDGARAIVRQL